mgnify:FL=1
MRVLGIIPARSGSKGILNKNIVNLNNKPLIYWTIKEALKSKINKLIVSTDSQKYKKISLSYGAEVPFIRPKALSKDTSKTIDLVIHAINFYKKKKIYFDYVMLLQPTCPFRTTKDINHSINLLRKKNSYKSVISLQKVESFHPARMKFIKNDTIDDKFFTRNFKDTNRQKLKKIFIRSGLIYLAKTKYILSKKTLEPKKSFPYITDSLRSTNIDTKTDLLLAKILAKRFL